MGTSPQDTSQNLVRRNVRATRLKQGLSQQELAEKAGLHPRYISRLETSDQNMTLDILDKIAKALDVDPADLLGKANVDLVTKDVRLLDEAIKGLQVFRSRVREI